MFYLIVCLSTFVIISESSAKEILLGGIKNSNVNDPEIQKVAEKAMEKVNAKTNYENLYKLVKVIDARTQVVAGVKYYLTILAAPTTCRKSSRKMNAAKCTIDMSKPKKQFKIEVRSAPWQNIFDVTLT
ncbi:Cystatin domain family protein [Acanthocheilonema viteae]